MSKDDYREIHMLKVEDRGSQGRGSSLEGAKSDALRIYGYNPPSTLRFPRADTMSGGYALEWTDSLLDNINYPKRFLPSILRFRNEYTSPSECAF